MKLNLTLLALASLGTAALAQTGALPPYEYKVLTSTSTVELPMMSESYKEATEAGPEYARKKVWKVVRDLRPSVQVAFGDFDRNVSPGTSDEIYVGLYNAICNAKAIRKERAYAMLSPELRATLSPMEVSNDMEQGRALRMFVDRRDPMIDIFVARDLMTEGLSMSRQNSINSAFMRLDPIYKDAIVEALNVIAAETKAPVYASTVVRRTWAMQPLPAMR